jgi:hypothetical protein
MFLVLVMSTVAGAQEPPLELQGDLRWIGSAESDYPVDAQGTSPGQGQWLDQRLRLGALVRPVSGLSLSTEWDLATGQVAGDTWQIPGEIDARHREERLAFSVKGFRPRRAALGGELGRYQLELGLVTSQWGLGMVANDGATDPVFGRADFGDRVVRARVTHVPSALAAGRPAVIVTGAADVVVQDEIASLQDDQLAMQGIFSALLVDRGRKLGTYLVLRHQLEADRSRWTDAGVLDAYGLLPLGQVRLEGEAAGILGRTNRSVTYAAREMLGVASFGATGAVSWLPGPEPTDLELSLRTGYASGDGNPDDAVSHDFTFDRDFGVGMVLFDELMGAIDAASYVRLTDPIYAGQAPDGVDALVGEGAFRRAAFVQPLVRSNHLPVELRAGLMFAFATAPFAEPFYTYRNGGVPTNHHDLPSSGRLLGTELDWGLEYDGTFGKARLGVELEGGHLLLGPALQGEGSKMLHLATATGRIRW